MAKSIKVIEASEEVKALGKRTVGRSAWMQFQADAWLDLCRDSALSFYLAFVVCAGLPNIIGLESESPDSGTAASSPANQFVLIALIGIALVIMWTKGVTLRSVLRGTAPYLAPLIIVGLSPYWSDEPDLAARRALRLILEYSFLTVLVSTYLEPREILRVIWRVGVFVAALDIALLIVPQLSFTEIGYQGVHGHKNQAGSFALLTFPIALAATVTPGIASTRIKAILLLAAVLLIIALSHSKTSTSLTLVSFILAGLFLALARSSARTILIFTLIAGGLLIFASLWITDFQSEDIFESMSIDPTLTGRDQVWQFTLAHISQRPWLGVGFGSFWDAGPTSKEFLFDFGITFAFGQAHNGYLDVLVQLGTVGMSCVIVMAFAILFRLFRLARAGYDNKVIVIAFMTFSVFWLHNITESTLLRPGTDMWIYFVLLTLTVFKTRPQ